MRALSPPICWQVRELINSSEGDGQYTARGGMINFELFESLMAKRVRDDDRESELKDAFRVLDKDGVGWISVAQMASICKVRALCHATSRSHPLARAHPVYALCLARCPQMTSDAATQLCCLCGASLATLDLGGYDDFCAADAQRSWLTTAR